MTLRKGAAVSSAEANAVRIGEIQKELSDEMSWRRDVGITEPPQDLLALRSEITEARLRIELAVREVGAVLAAQLERG